MTHALVILAQAAAIGYYVKVAVVIAAIVGIGLIGLRMAGVNVPPEVTRIIWIVVIVIVVLFAINLLLAMM